MEEENLENIEKKLKEVKQEENRNKDLDRMMSLYVDYDGVDKLVRFADLIEELRENTIKENEVIKTNIPKLDRIIDGFRAGDLNTISGLTGQGKTSLLQSFLREFAKQEIGTLFFTYEVRAEQFLAKFGDNIPEFSYMPRQHKPSDINWLEKRIIEGISKFNTKVVMIDHLHYLLDIKELGKFGNTSLLIGSIMRRLKEIALLYNIVIFIVAHTRNVKLGMGEKLRIDSIRDSSFVAQESDYVFLIKRKEEECQGELAVVKNRFNGILDKIDLVYIDNQFKEHEEELDEKEIKKLI